MESEKFLQDDFNGILKAESVKNMDKDPWVQTLNGGAIFTSTSD